jgi:hypothetical protein
MTNAARITEIDISKQARALAWLRLVDYVLVIVCGLWALGLLGDLMAEFPSFEISDWFVSLALLAVLCFAAYTGWRHVGVIDPAVWRAYRVVFPLLLAICLMSAWSIWMSVPEGTLVGLMEQGRTQFVQQVNGLFGSLQIGVIAIIGWISLMLLRRMKIAGMGVTVEQFLTLLTKQAGSSAIQATGIRPINRPRGIAIGVAGALILAFNLLPLPESRLLADAKLRMNNQIQLLGFFLLVRARRYFQVDADSLLAVDRRPPILFLRSFDDDEKQRFSTSQKALLDFSLETRLSNHFSRFGPFVAIGSPKETMPQPGAARVLLSNDEWQPRVVRWMKDAQTIIMYSGKTHWVNWELRQVIENACSTRLILMIPEIKKWRSAKRNEEISARVKQIREVFKGTPWEDELSNYDNFDRLRAALFRADGSMIMLKSRSRSRDSYHLAALVTHQLMIEADAANGAIVPELVEKYRIAYRNSGEYAA